MSMKAVKQVMKRAKWGMLATSDGRWVGVRPMGLVAWVGRELWSASMGSSDKARQLARVPYAEYCFIDPAGEHVRIEGRCTASTRPADKKKLADLMPVLLNYFGEPANPAWVVLRLRPRRIRLWVEKRLDYKVVRIQ